ncbi:MAG: efflux RND transporter permease subunit, partial [Anaerovoracaceae bacterium]
AVGVGMLVDNSIVVIENIYRLRTLGYSKIKAAAMGAGQVSSAITSSTITTICVFFPIVFVDGLTKQVFLDMALTVTYSLLASLLIALTVVPAMSRGMLTKIKEKTVFGKDSRAITLYQKSVAFALEHKAWLLGITLMLFLASIGLGVARGFSYMPGMVGQEISASVTLPADTPKEECMRRSDELAEKIKDIQGVETVGVLLNSDVGAVMGMSAGKKDFTKVEFYILIGEEEIGRNGEISKEISKIGKDYAEKITVSGDTDMTAAMGGNGVGVNLYADDLDTLREAEKQIEEALKQVEGIREVSQGNKTTIPELKITVDKNKAIENGTTVAQVYGAVTSTLSKEKVATAMTQEDGARNVVLSSSKTSAVTEENLEDLLIPVQDRISGETKEIRLGDIAELSQKETLNEIKHDNQKRTLRVTGEVDKEYNVTKVTQAAQAAVEKLELPSGVTLDFDGENEQIMDAMKQLLQMLILGL